MKNKKRINKVVNQIKQAEKKSASNNKATSKKNNNLVYPAGRYTEAIGRRKVSTARVRIYEKGGNFIVNDQDVKDYFASTSLAAKKYNLPFSVTKTEGDFGVTVLVKGSGKRSQLDAIVHGLARALEEFNPKLRVFLKEEGLLTRDSRMKETRKPGRGGKARSKRQSPKR
ncbi:MAG: 30S ribosomal protein S9 [Patescibacteria group bacterium]|nr:30S ribosomal protein S9 [Patescibacteria group bacterium]